MAPRTDSRVARAVDQVLYTRQGNLVGGVGLLFSSLVAAALVRSVGSGIAVSESTGPLILPLFMAAVSVPAFGGMVLVIAGLGDGIQQGLRLGVVAYAGFGVLLVLFGLPGALPSGFAPAGPFWPFFVLWLHPCILGFGLWACAF